MVVALSILAVSFTPLGQAGLTLVGSVPSGLPDLGFPGLRPREVDGVIPLAFGCLEKLRFFAGAGAFGSSESLVRSFSVSLSPRGEILLRNRHQRLKIESGGQAG